MSYLFFAFWVLAGYVRVHVPGIRLQYNCYTEYTVPQRHNMYTITITPTTPLPLSIFHPSWPIPSWWKNQPSPGEGGGGCTPIPFYYISTITYKVVVCASAERADTLPLFLLYTFMYSVMQAFSIVNSILFMWWSAEAEFMNVQYR